MKKFFCIFSVVFFSFVLAGCENGNTQIPVVSKGISFNAEVAYNCQTIMYYVNIDEFSTTEIELLKNGKKSGFKSVFSNENVIFKYNELEYQTSLSSLPDGIIVDLIYNILKDAQGKLSTISDSGNAYVSGKTDKYNYTLTIGATGLPIRIEESNYDISALIKNVSIT